MSRQLIIIGAGYTGERLVDRMLREQPAWSIVATSRDAHKLDALRARGVHGVELDLLSEREQGLDRLAEVVEQGAWLVYSAPTLYRTYEPERHLEPLRGVLERAARWQCKGVIYLSSTSVYGDHDGAWVDEESVRAPSSALGQMRADLEDLMLGWPEGLAPLHMYVARVVGIYGPGRTLADYIRKGRYKLVDGGEKVTNRVHVEDLVGAIWAMIVRGEPGRRAYNVCDGNPLPVKVLVELLVRNFGVPRPEACTLEAYAETRGPNVAARWKNTYRCTNERLRTELGWQPLYEDARAGLRAIMSEEH